jgi:hypothetical protein
MPAAASGRRFYTIIRSLPNTKHVFQVRRPHPCHAPARLPCARCLLGAQLLLGGNERTGGTLRGAALLGRLYTATACCASGQVHAGLLCIFSSYIEASHSVQRVPFPHKPCLGAQAAAVVMACSVIIVSPGEPGAATYCLWCAASAAAGASESSL